MDLGWAPQECSLCCGAEGSTKLADPAATTPTHGARRAAPAPDPPWSQAHAPTLINVQEMFIRDAALHTWLTRASPQPQKAVPPAHQRRLSVSIFCGSSINLWLRFNSFLLSLGIFALCCQEAIYSDYFKDIVNICCCTHIKQEVLVLRTEVRLLLALAL